MLYNRIWVVFTHNASCCLLDTAWGFPRLINVLCWVLLQTRNILSAKIKVKFILYFENFHTEFNEVMILLNVVSIFVRLLAERDGRVNPEELVEKGACRQPLPVSSIQSPVAIQQELLKDLQERTKQSKSW